MWSAEPERQRRNTTMCGPQRPPGLRCLGPFFAKMPQRPPGLRCPHKRKSIHTNLSDSIVKMLIVCFRRCGISLLSHIHINMFDAFVKKVIILHCICGMALILHIHTNLLQTVTILTMLMNFLS